MREYSKRYAKKNPQKVKAWKKKTRAKRKKQDAQNLKNWRKANPGKDAEYSQRQRQKLLEETVAAYGGKCRCCGESNPLFLTIDHVENDGAAERAGMGDGPTTKSKKGRAGVNFYRFLKKSGYPRGRYQLLCFNCNCGKARNKGVCPHQKENYGKA